jgi:FKBP-type peptidyl-prolyl cis-trans isomerase
LVQQKARQQEQLLFSTIKDKPGVGMFPTGVRYVVLKAGKGQRPLETDSIKLHLIAKLPDGTVVEDTYQTNKPFSATAGSFFPGLNDALQNMPEGSKWQVFVPSNLAYADKGTTLIPPYSALILEVELLEVKPSKK